MMKKQIIFIRLVVVTVMLWTVAGIAVAEEEDMVTASKYFQQVSQRYEEIEDYIADITLRGDDVEEMEGVLYYQHPDKMRIDFSQPEEQVLVSDGDTLTLYIPELDVTMEQSLDARQQKEEITAMATRDGLGLLQRLYNISYYESPSPVPLEEGSEEEVVKLELTWRNPSEGFREIILSIDDDMKIRRMVGTTVRYNEVVLDFENVRANQSIPDSRFEYRSPPSSNRFRDFLFRADN